jgi:hypothetical protein
MNEVREICARMLDGPEPPLRGADEILATARRERARRGRLTTAGAGAAALAMALGVATIIGPGLGRPDPVVAGGTLAPDAPLARAAPAHGRVMTDHLLRAVPAGYASSAVPSVSDSEVVHPVDPNEAGRVQVLAVATVRIFAGAGEGRLFAYLVNDGASTPPANPCAADLIRTVGDAPACQIWSVDGVAVRLVVAVDPHRGQVIQATRFLDGGRLIVGAWQGTPLDPIEWAVMGGTASQFLAESGARTAWQRPPLDPVQVAEIAGDPAMVP